MENKSKRLIASSDLRPRGACAIDQTVPLDLVPAVDLVGARRYRLWSADDQRPRETCVAFAVAACVELLSAGTGDVFVPQSAQYLYWHMRTREWSGSPPPGWRDGATKLGYAKEILSEKGICARELCPYVAFLSAGAPLEGEQPSPMAEAAAARNRFTESYYLDLPPDETRPRPPGVAHSVYRLLAEGYPVAVAVPKFPLMPGSSLTNWDNPAAAASGVVMDPAPTSIPGRTAPDGHMAGHAVCIVGFQPDAGEPRGGWFIFRNSVGVDWAYAIDPAPLELPHVPARGYGALSASYVEKFCWEILSLCPRLPEPVL